MTTDDDHYAMIAATSGRNVDWASACAAHIVNIVLPMSPCERFTFLRDMILSIIDCAIEEDRARLRKSGDN